MEFKQYRIQGISTPLATELDAIQLALSLTNTSQETEIRSDCKLAIQKIRTIPATWERIYKIQQSLRSRPKVRISWTKRENNKTADELAREARVGSKGEIFIHKFPNTISEELIKEKRKEKLTDKVWKKYVKMNCGQTINYILPSIKNVEYLGKKVRTNLFSHRLIKFVNGHNNLNRFINLVDPTRDPKCRLCSEGLEKWETFNRILQISNRFQKNTTWFGSHLSTAGK